MLFDLQSPGRKRFIQVVFGALAVIFAVSFVFLGVGTGVGGSPLEAIGIGGSSSSDEVLEDDISAQEERLAENPKDTAALTEIINLRYQAANTKYDVDEASGQAVFNAEVEEQLQKGADAWDRYLKVTAKPDPSAALIAVQTFTALAQGQLTQASGAGGEAALADADDALSNWTAAGEAQLIVADRGSSAVQTAQAAEYLYLGGDFAAADEAAQQALAEAKPGQRAAIQKRLDSAEKQGRQLNQQIDAYRKQLAKAQQQGAPAAPARAASASSGAVSAGAVSAAARSPLPEARPRDPFLYCGGRAVSSAGRAGDS